MKKIFILMLLGIVCQQLRAQSLLGDLFNQKKEEKKNMITQILFTKTYRSALESGYKICKTGWNTIHGFTSGEFNLHDAFFKSLWKVNPVVSQYPKADSILVLQQIILSKYKDSYRIISGSDVFTSAEKDYIYQVYTRLMTDCGNALDELHNITTDNQLQMKDDERLEKIDRLYSEMLDRLKFVNGFSNNALLLLQYRKKETQDISTLKNLNL